MCDFYCVFFPLVEEEEQIWSTGVGQLNSFSVSWPWLSSLPSVTAICSLSKFKFMVSPGFAGRKRGLKAEGSIGPHQTRFFSAPLNWCQNFSGANPTCNNKKEDYYKEAHSMWSWCRIRHLHGELNLSHHCWACCMEASTYYLCAFICVSTCTWVCIRTFSQVSVPCCSMSK